MDRHGRSLLIASLVALGGCSSGSSTPVASFPAPTATPAARATGVASSTGSSAQFRFSIPVNSSTTAAALGGAVAISLHPVSSASRKPEYVSTGTVSVTIAITAVNGVAPSPAISQSVTISSCPIVSNNYVCTVAMPSPPGSDTFVFSAFGSSSSVLISQQSVTKTVVAGPNDFTTAPVTLDENPQTTSIIFGLPSGVTAGAGFHFTLHGSESRTFSYVLKDAAGKTVTGPGTPSIAFSSTSAAVNVTTNTAAGTFTVAPTGLSQSTPADLTLTITPANPSTDGLSTSSSTFSGALAIRYQIFAVPLASTTTSAVNLYVLGCPTPATCQFVPSQQVTAGDGHGIIAETSTTPAFGAGFDASGDLIVCTTSNGPGPVQEFLAAQVGAAAPGAPTNSWSAGINGIKGCDVAPSSNAAFAVVDAKGYSATPADIATEYSAPFSTSTWQLGYVPPSTPSNSVNVPASVNELVASGATVSSAALLAVAIEGPSNIACTPSGTAACGEIALVSAAGTGATCNMLGGDSLPCGATFIGPIFNNSGAFLTAWDAADSRLIVACGTPDGSGKYEVLAYPINVSAGTAGSATTIVDLAAKPVKLAVSTGGEVAVAYQSSASTNQIDTYSAANSLIGSVTGITTNVRGLAFYDAGTVVLVSSSGSSAGTMSAYALTATAPLATTAFSTSAPSSVAISFNL